MNAGETKAPGPKSASGGNDEGGAETEATGAAGGGSAGSDEAGERSDGAEAAGAASLGGSA